MSLCRLAKEAISSRICRAAMGLIVISLLGLGGQHSKADEERPANVDRIKSLGRQFSTLRTQYQDLTYPELRAQLKPEPAYRIALPFKIAQARYFDLVNQRLKLTEKERELFQQNGLVSIDHGRRLSFPGAYEQIYTSDLPVLITSDSILHAWHRSYDEILNELETSYFSWTLDEILADCQAALIPYASSSPRELNGNLLDVDLYLGVARKLLHTTPPSTVWEQALSTRSLLNLAKTVPTAVLPAIQYSMLGQDVEIDAVMARINSLRLQSPSNGEMTAIYGGTRYVDYSQFRPRGHYTESAELAAYFRCLMWLGRADCGWEILPDKREPSRQLDSRRELRNSVLLAELVRDCGALTRLCELEQMLSFLVGHGDSCGVCQLLELCQTERITSARELLDDNVAQRLEHSIAAGLHGEQLIRSQTLDPGVGTQPAPPPAIFQLFGQRFVIDSFVLSRVVHEEIVYRGRKVQRHRPAALDVMAALGNREAVELLANELGTWHYSANLLACRKLVDSLDSDFWDESLHHAWLDVLRSLNADLTVEPHAPAVLQTRVWQRKQLQTQLASWAELRRDNILYAKQSYGTPGCAFPCGFVEPYPEFYAKLKRIADTAGRRLGGLAPTSKDDKRRAVFEQNRKRQVAFFSEMSITMGMLEKISLHELHGQALTGTETSFLRETFDSSGKLKFGSAQLPDFSGWYCRLFYSRLQEPTHWAPLTTKPVVADVHTNPQGEEVLESATGDAQLLIIAINDGMTPTVFVGPISSYYEFWQPAGQRLTDQEWQRRLASGSAPSRPEWTAVLQAPTTSRGPEKPRVTATRRDNDLWVTIDNAGMRMKVSAATVRQLSKQENLHALDLSKSDVDDAVLRPLARLVDLRSLDLNGTKISDKGVASLKVHRHLQFLNLSDTAITDAAVPSLVQLNYLSQLELRNTRLSESALRELGRQLPHTELLH